MSTVCAYQENYVRNAATRSESSGCDWIEVVRFGSFFEGELYNIRQLNSCISDVTDNYYGRGVAIVIENKIASYVIDYITVSNRVIIVMLTGQPINILS